MYTYYYKLDLPDKYNYVWRGAEYRTRKEAEKEFKEICENWIEDPIPRDPYWWEFSKTPVEKPDLRKDVFKI